MTERGERERVVVVARPRWDGGVGVGREIGLSYLLCLPSLSPQVEPLTPPDNQTESPQPGHFSLANIETTSHFNTASS